MFGTASLESTFQAGLT